MSEENFSQTVPLEARDPYTLRVNLSEGISESGLKNALESGETGFLHSFTTGSAVDGPGVRLVAWTTGCQFRCLYCHNPDTWKIRNGMPVPLKRATEEVAKYRGGLKIMGGGFTLSGGEPLMQDRFAVRLFESVKQMEIHTALDTNGALGNRVSDNEMKFIDLVLLDIKTWDNENHIRLTGVKVDAVKEFAQRLSDLRKPVWLRYVLVPDLTDNLPDISRLAEFAAGLGNIERVDVLPFHQLGEYKWKELGMDYKLSGLEPPSAEKIRSVVDCFRNAGLNAI